MRLGLIAPDNASACTELRELLATVRFATIGETLELRPLLVQVVEALFADFAAAPRFTAGVLGAIANRIARRVFGDCIAQLANFVTMRLVLTSGTRRGVAALLLVAIIEATLPNSPDVSLRANVRAHPFVRVTLGIVQNITLMPLIRTNSVVVGDSHSVYRTSIGGSLQPTVRSPASIAPSNTICVALLL